jgi:hypothetical protein
LVILVTGLTGCRPEETPDARRQTPGEPGATGGTGPSGEETPDARRQTPQDEPGATGDVGPPVSETPDARRQTPEEEATTRVIEVIERAGWGAAAAGPGMGVHAIERLTIHHTGVALEDNRLAPSRLRDHQGFHQMDRGWPDLAYHFAIDRDGNIYEGRSPEFRGDTATSYDPTGHLLVVLEGNFDIEETVMAQLRSLSELLAWAASHYSVGVESIKSHRDYVPGETACPGDNLYPLVESGELARAVGSLLTEEVIEMIYLRGEEALARIAEIEAR